jgi:hypothetical protein
MFPCLHPLPHAFPAFLPFFITNSQRDLGFADFLGLALDFLGDDFLG